MRELNVGRIEDAVKELCIRANRSLPDDLRARIAEAEKTEDAGLPKRILGELLGNLDAAKELGLPICQDTGMAVVFVELGRDVHLCGGSLEAAVNRGVAGGYADGLLRCSVVRDPFDRVNTGDNTPAVLHLRLTEGERIKITVAPKGFGSENMSRLKMFTPAASKEELMDWVVQVVREAGGNPCPPVVLGVGLGGDFELCACLAKRALCRPVGEQNPVSFYAAMEEELLQRLNGTGVGPQGFGGRTTALAVNIETAPTHIAGLPAAVNFGCHANRCASAIL